MHKKNMQSNQEIKELSIQFLFENKHYMNKLFYFILGFIVFFNLACEKKQVEPPKKKLQNYDYETIYKHVSQVLMNPNQTSTYNTWEKSSVIRYQIFHLNDPELEKVFAKRVKEFEKFTGLTIIPAKPKQEYDLGIYFITDDLQEQIKQDPNLENIAKTQNRNLKVLQKEISQTFANDNNFIYQIFKFNRKQSVNTNQEYLVLDHHVIMIQPEYWTLKNIEYHFLKSMMYSLLGIYFDSQIIQNSLTRYASSHVEISNVISKFDQAFLKSVYHSNLPDQLTRKEAATFISKFIFQELQKTTHSTPTQTTFKNQEKQHGTQERYDREMIYKHVSEVLSVGKKDSLYTKWYHKAPLPYRIYGLEDDLKLIHQFKQKIEEVAELTRLNIYPARKGEKSRLDYVFLDENWLEDIKKDLFKNIAKKALIDHEELKIDLYNSFLTKRVFLNNSFLEAEVKYKSGKKIYQIYYGFVVTEKKYLNENREGLFLELAYTAMLNNSSSKIIPNSLMYPRKNRELLVYLPFFDKVFLKALYHPSIPYGIEIQKLVNILSQKIAIELGEHHVQ